MADTEFIATEQSTEQTSATTLRQSRYTTAVQTEEGLLLYNAARGTFANAQADLADCYTSCGQTHHELAEELVRDGFLTSLTPEEELDEQRALFAAQRTDPHTLKVAFGLTYACNCRCVYCYEQDKAVSKQRMTPELLQAIYAFIQRRYDNAPFDNLYVEWYGGEPTLCLDIIEAAAAHLIAWCIDHNVSYDSMMLSNGVRIDEAAADLLVRAQVTSVYFTIDGPRDLHNARRPAVDCEDPFERNMQAIALLKERGIRVDAAMNTDKVNAARYEELEAYTQEHFGMHVNPVKLNDYAHSFGCGEAVGGPGSFTGIGAGQAANAATQSRGCTFGKPDFDLYTHPEFARQQFEWFAASNPTAIDVLTLLQPATFFCAGQKDTYFVIDALGDMYKCDGWMGDPNYKLCNLLTDSPGEVDAACTSTITFDPCNDEKCAPCELLPLCWGNCIWERTQTGMPCHPLKTTLSDYLQLLASLQ